MGGVTRGQGERLARDELSRAIYHPSAPIAVRIYDAIQREAARIYAAVTRATPGGWWGFVALLALVVIVVGLVFVSAGPLGRQHRLGPALWAGRPVTSQQHREQAQRLAAAGDFSAAILECMRAIAAGLEERAVIMPNPGLTADELAGEAGRVLPGQAAALRQAAVLFDDICYGKRTGTPSEYERLRDLDSAIQNAKPAPVPAPAPAGVGAGA